MGRSSPSRMMRPAGWWRFCIRLFCSAGQTRNADGSALAFHLHKAYTSDAFLKPFAEKAMEALVYHYEAVLRSARGRSFL